MKETPFFAVGNEELDKSMAVKKGDLIDVDVKGKTLTLPLQYGEKLNEDGSKTESSMLGFVKTNKGIMYLVSINGSLLSNAKLHKGDPR